MAKGVYKGIVVGGAAWTIPAKKEGEKEMSGYTYRVLTLADLNEETGLHEEVSLVFVSAKSKQFEKDFKYGDEVEFDGEYQEGFQGAKGKMKYTDMRKAAAAKGVK